MSTYRRDVVFSRNGCIAFENRCRVVLASLNEVEEEVGHVDVRHGGRLVEDAVPGGDINLDRDVLALPGSGNASEGSNSCSRCEFHLASIVTRYS